MKALQEAFALFTQETQRLEASYRSLQQEFQILQQRFRTSSQTLEAIASHMSDGLIFIDCSGRLLLINSSAARLLNCEITSVQGAYFEDLFSDGLFGFSMKEALQKPFSPTTLFLTLHSEAHVFKVEVSATPIPSKGILLLLRDKTELRRLEQSIDRNERLKELGEMAAALAHEIRNPLGGIQGFASLLVRDLKDQPAQQQMASAILEGTQALNHLVTNVLHYARPLEVHFTACDLIGIIEEVLTLVRADSNKRGECLFYCTLESAPLMADKALLKRAFLNIIQNAFEACEGEAFVTVTLQYEAPFYCISISDNGEGIAPEHKENIFTPFFTTKSSGTGLGLSETQKIIHVHEGTIEIFSEIGHGSTFTIKVPDYGSP